MIEWIASILRCVRTPMPISTVFTKGNNFPDFLFISLDNEDFQK